MKKKLTIVLVGKEDALTFTGMPEQEAIALRDGITGTRDWAVIHALNSTISVQVKNVSAVYLEDDHG